MMQYEIELYTADREYDYDLNAQDGSILSWDFEALKAWNQGGSAAQLRQLPSTVKLPVPRHWRTPD